MSPIVRVFRFAITGAALGFGVWLLVCVAAALAGVGEWMVDHSLQVSNICMIIGAGAGAVLAIRSWGETDPRRSGGQ